MAARCPYCGATYADASGALAGVQTGLAAWLAEDAARRAGLRRPIPRRSPASASMTRRHYWTMLPPARSAAKYAQLARDAEMRRLHDALTVYRFDLHKGYPTALHLELLRAHPDLAGRTLAGYDFVAAPYQANDGETNSGIATVTITISGRNDGPVADSQSVTTAEEVAQAICDAGSEAITLQGDVADQAAVERRRDRRRRRQSCR